MYRVCHSGTMDIVTDYIQYEDALSMMNKLNCVKDKRHYARNWIDNIERELCIDSNGKVDYGMYIIIDE
jgi:hypothetical protein